MGPADRRTRRYRYVARQVTLDDARSRRAYARRERSELLTSAASGPAPFHGHRHQCSGPGHDSSVTLATLMPRIALRQFYAGLLNAAGRAEHGPGRNNPPAFGIRQHLSQFLAAAPGGPVTAAPHSSMPSWLPRCQPPGRGQHSSRFDAALSDMQPRSHQSPAPDRGEFAAAMQLLHGLVECSSAASLRALSIPGTSLASRLFPLSAARAFAIRALKRSGCSTPSSYLRPA